MLNSQSKLILYLSGGLGNQLFQLATGIHFNSKVLVVNTSQVRGEFELQEFLKFLSRKRGIQIIQDHTTPSKCFIKRHNIVLRTTQWLGRSFFQDFAVHLLIKSMNLFSQSTSRKLYTQQANFSTFRNGNIKFDIVGYFQSEATASLLRDDLNDYLNLTYSFAQDMQEIEAQSEMTLHIRRGDYASEEKIGMLSLTYFVNSLTKITKGKRLSKIKLFSNGKIDIRQLKSIPGVGVISEIDADCAMELLAKMRNAHFFLISNSTLSWWAAFLCELPNKEVFAPYPWFERLAEPVNLIPKGWIRLPAIWSQGNET
jgi:hypothetical protein